MNLVLRKHLDQFVLAYLDNILIYSETLEEHKDHVRTVLKKLQKARLVVNPRKCNFYTQKVNFLGFVISLGKIEIEEDKVKAVLE